MGSSSDNSARNQQNVQNSMAQMAGQRTSNETLLNQQAQLQNNMMATGMPLLDQLISSAMGVFQSNPNMPGGQGPMPTPQLAQTYQANQQPVQGDALQQRIMQLMANQGMDQSQALANQQHAIRMGADLDNNGAVSNDEWRMFQAGRPSQGRFFGGGR